MKNSKPNFLGIDFGTSNSAAATFVDGKVKPIYIEPNKDTLPTAVFFNYEEQRQQYGTLATENLLEGTEGRYMRALKSVLGTSLMRESRLMLGKQMDFYDIITSFLVKIKQAAEKSENKVFDYALSGRPVFFHSNDDVKNQKALEDLKKCYKNAGFKHVEFMFEPEAAAYANKHHDHKKLGLIVDIGGGTSDYCLFRSSAAHDGIDIVASHGVRLGGTNFDKALSLQYFMPLLGKDAQIKKFMSDGFITPPQSIYHDLATWEKIPFVYSNILQKMVADLEKQAIEPKLFTRLLNLMEDRAGHELAFLAETAKIDINAGANETAIKLDLLEKSLAISLNKQNLADVMKSLCDMVELHALETLKLANCKIEAVDQVIFVGGSSQMHLIQDRLKALFPHAEFITSNVYTAVVGGLAIAANTKFK